MLNISTSSHFIHVLENMNPSQLRTVHKVQGLGKLHYWNKTLSRPTIKVQLFFVVLYIFRKFKNVIWSVYNKSVTGKKDEFKFYEAPLIFFGLELGPNEGERGFIDPVVVFTDLYLVSLTVDQV